MKDLLESVSLPPAFLFNCCGRRRVLCAQLNPVVLACRSNRLAEPEALFGGTFPLNLRNHILFRKLGIQLSVDTTSNTPLFPDSFLFLPNM